MVWGHSKEDRGRAAWKKSVKKREEKKKQKRKMTREIFASKKSTTYRSRKILGKGPEDSKNTSQILLSHLGLYLGQGFENVITSLVLPVILLHLAFIHPCFPDSWLSQFLFFILLHGIWTIFANDFSFLEIRWL